MPLCNVIVVNRDTIKQGKSGSVESSQYTDWQTAVAGGYVQAVK